MSSTSPGTVQPRSNSDKNQLELNMNTKVSLKHGGEDSEPKDHYDLC